MIPLQRMAGLLVVTLALGACRGPGRPKLLVTAAWHDVPGAGCVHRVLRLDVATVAFMRVQAPGAVANADEDGHAVLDVRPAALGRAERVRVTIEGEERELAVPPAGAPRAVVVSPAAATTEATPVWRGRATGAVAAEAPAIGVVDGQDLIVRLVGCDLRGGRVADGSVIARGPDELEVRLALARRLAGATSLAARTETFAVDIESSDGAHGTVRLDGALDVAAALAAMQSAAGGARSTGARAWDPGGERSILVIGPGLADVAAADALLRGATIAEAAGVLTVATAAGGVHAVVTARASGQVIAERTFATADEGAGSSAGSGGPPWGAILAWARDVQRGGAAPHPSR